MFVLQDDETDGEEQSGAPRILGINVPSEMLSPFTGLEGVQKMDQHKQHVGSLHRDEDRVCGP